MHLEKIEKNFEEVNIIIPQESTSYVKMPTHIIKWQAYLPPTTYNVLTYLVSRIHKQYRYAFPSLKTMVFDCNISENTIVKAIKLLEKLTLIKVDRLHKNNRYYLSPPVLPNEKILKKYLPKMLDKFHSTLENKKAEQKQYTLKYSKVYDFSTAKKEMTTSITEEILPQPLQSKQRNLQNSKFTEQHHIEFSEKQNEDYKTLKEFGVADKTSKKLCKEINENIDLKDFIKYVFAQYKPKNKIQNPPGLLIKAIEDRQTDYLENLNKKEKVKSDNKAKNELLEKLQSLKEEAQLQAEKIWEKSGKEDKDLIKRETLKENPEIKELRLSGEILHSYYIEYIKYNYLGLSDASLKLLENNTIGNMDYLNQLEKELMD